MKFLETLTRKYKQYELQLPNDLAEGVNTIPSTGSTSTAGSTTQSSAAAPAQTPDITSMTTNPDTLKIKKETDEILKQVATLLKKQASDVYNKLRNTRKMP